MRAPEGRGLWFHYHLAAQLGKSVREVLDFPETEIAGWAAYLAVQAEGER